MSAGSCETCGRPLSPAVDGCVHCWEPPEEEEFFEPTPPAAPEEAQHTLMLSEDPASGSFSAGPVSTPALDSLTMVPPDLTPSSPGSTIIRDPGDRYEILRELGRGGQGVVYQVQDLELDEVIAMKVLDLAGDQSAIERFRHELKVARRMKHPNVVPLYDLLNWQGRLAVTMEYIAGDTLEARLKEGPLPPATILHYLREICSALQAAHDLGVTHRDLKPANVIIDEDDQPHVVDFGVALLRSSDSASNKVIGTPSYMAPELIFSPQYADHRVDIYALGILAYKMGTGRVPFEAPDLNDLIARIKTEAPVDPRKLEPKIPPALGEAILRCLAKAPDDRFRSAWRMYESLSDSRPATGPVKVDAPTDPTKAPRGKVLFVDDDEDLRRLVAVMLGKFGVKIIQAGDAAEGVDLAMREQPGLILLDHHMPDLDGGDALELLRGSEMTQDIPVVMVTASTDDGLREELKGKGAACFLRKPIEPDVFELLLDRYLPRRT